MEFFFSVKNLAGALLFRFSASNMDNFKNALLENVSDPHYSLIDNDGNLVFDSDTLETNMVFDDKETKELIKLVKVFPEGYHEMMENIKTSRGIYHQLPDCWRRNFMFMHEVITMTHKYKHYAENYMSMSSIILRNNKSFMEKAVKINPKFFKYASYHVREDPEIIALVPLRYRNLKLPREKRDKLGLDHELDHLFRVCCAF